MCYNKKLVGEKLRSHRLFFMMTQRQVAECAHLSEHFHRGLEQGTVGMSLNTLYALCHVLRFTPAALFRETPSEHGNSVDCLLEILETCSPEVRRTVQALINELLRKST